MGDLFADRSAVISPDGLYRYSLHRIWDENAARGILGWIMLNPSTADADQDDPTIARCCERARRLGFGGIMVANLFAFRATDPLEMKAATDPVGPKNDAVLKILMGECGTVVAGWGAHGSFMGRASGVRAMIADAGHQLYCLGTTKAGEPGHPLYISYDAPMIPLVFEQGAL